MAPLGQHLRRYAVPLLLFSAGLFYQLVVLPSSFPTSHYDVLGVRRFATIPEVADAYEKLSSKWESGSDVPTLPDFVKICYAFELLTNPTWKRDYDEFGIDEQLHIIEKLKRQYAGDTFSKIKLPLLKATPSDFDDSFNKLTPEDFMSDFGKTKAWLIQVYSSGSPRSAEFANSWKRIAILLDGVAGSSVIELGDSKLAYFLAERRYTGQTFFRNGLPALIAFPPNCRSLDCCLRYEGDLAVDTVVDWMATSILGLPRILYYSKETLDQQFIAKSGRHKVKAIFFSNTGQRALPFLRKAAKEYQIYASFAFVLWKEEELSIWFNKFEVESAPAIVFLKDPGVKPTIYYGTWNSSSFADIMEQNKYQVLPQLRSATSMELGCDARGKSRAGNDTTAWYCVILAGRPSWELNRMRETMRRIQKTLSNYGSAATEIVDNIQPPRPAIDALQSNRLTFTWLDGETQSKYCSFYLYSETSYETCGPRSYGDLTDVPRLFLVRYRRNSTENDSKVEKKRKSVWDMAEEVDTNLASQLVARYNGSEDFTQIIKWISQTIEDGDTRTLPYFRTQTPELTPEDADPTFIQGIQGILSNGGGMKRRLRNIKESIFDCMRDPRLGPIMLLGACISFGSIYLQKDQAIKPATKDEGRTRKRERRQTSREESKDRPSSITDAEPEGAYQLLSSGSDSE